MDQLINDALNNFTMIIDNSFWFAPLFALAAGILTSVTPCSLSSIPLIIAFVGGSGKIKPAAAFRFSLIFAFGTALTFTALGAAASFIGRIFSLGSIPLWYIFLGLLMIVLALQIWGIITVIPSSYVLGRNKKQGCFGALIAGVLAGFFSSPCATPVLLAILALVAHSGNSLWGIFLLLLYSIGHSILVIFAGTFMGLTGNLVGNPQYARFSKGVNILLGFVILMIGLYLLYLGF